MTSKHVPVARALLSEVEALDQLFTAHQNRQVRDTMPLEVERNIHNTRVVRKKAERNMRRHLNKL